MDSLGDLLGVCDRDVQIDAWMGLAKRFDAWRQPIICNSRLAATFNEPRLRPAKSFKTCAAATASHNRVCLIEEVAARLSQYDAAADAVK
jgi:hypothetical protein